MKRGLISSLCSMALFSVGASHSKLHCWLVADDFGDSPHTMLSVSNRVDKLNKVFSQVAMDFSIASFSWTNNTYLTDIVYTNASQIAELCSITNGTDGLELYFVRSITHNIGAFWVPSGIVVSENAGDIALAHEIGHACGLDDIYDTHRDTPLMVSGNPAHERMPLDWGWYQDDATQSGVLRRLLMYGYEIQGQAKEADISRGDVLGLWYTSRWDYVDEEWKVSRDWQIGMAPVGFKTHGNRAPVSQ